MKVEIGLITESLNVQLADRVRSMELTGKKIVKLQTGDPDFATPRAIVKEAYASMGRGETHYCASRGIIELRRAISEKVLRSNGLVADPDKNILVTHGASHGVYLALSSIINAGDEVIVISPYWMPYVSDILLAGGIPRFLETHIEGRFLPNPDQIISLIGSKTKAVIINSPNNPTGAVYSKELLQEIGRICCEHNIYIVSDEVYEDLVYDVAHVSIQALFPEYKRIVSVFSFSKSYAMTGWRLGYLVASEEVTESISKLGQYTITSLSPFVQKAGIAALTSEFVAKDLQAMKAEYRWRRDFIAKSIEDTSFKHRIFIPDGAFYLFVDLKGIADRSSDFVWSTIEQYGVSFSPGLAFGKFSDRYIRMTFAADRNSIKYGLDTLKEVLK